MNDKRKADVGGNFANIILMRTRRVEMVWVSRILLELIEKIPPWAFVLRAGSYFTSRKRSGRRRHFSKHLLSFSFFCHQPPPFKHLPTTHPQHHKRLFVIFFLSNPFFWASLSIIINKHFSLCLEKELRYDFDIAKRSEN
jgi:hypothetical protein